MQEALSDALKSTLKERERMARWFRQRACERQGIPYDDSMDPMPIELTVKHEAAPDVPKPSAPPAAGFGNTNDHASVTPAPTVDNASPLALFLKWAAVFGGLMLGGAGIGALLSGGKKQPNPPAESRDSLLQWLEDEGEHIP